VQALLLVVTGIAWVPLALGAAVILGRERGWEGWGTGFAIVIVPP